MDVLGEYFDKVSRKMKILENDIARIIKNKETIANNESDKPKKEASKNRLMNLKSFQPVTRLRKSKEEVIQAKEKPELTFVMDQISDIFKG